MNEWMNEGIDESIGVRDKNEAMNRYMNELSEWKWINK